MINGTFCFKREEKLIKVLDLLGSNRFNGNTKNNRFNRANFYA